MFAGLLAVTACGQMPPPGPPPGGPTDPVPEAYLRGSEFDKPNIIRLSWGLQEIAGPANGSENFNYPWSEVRSRLAMRR
jgi:hypothetical protein